MEKGCPQATAFGKQTDKFEFEGDTMQNLF